MAASLRHPKREGLRTGTRLQTSAGENHHRLADLHQVGGADNIGSGRRFIHCLIDCFSGSFLGNAGAWKALRKLQKPSLHKSGNPIKIKTTSGIKQVQVDLQ